MYINKQLITMISKELSRYEIIKRLIRKEIDGTEASKQMNLSVRQVKNIKARVIKEGPKGVIHKNRGRVSNRRTKPEVIEEAKYWLKEEYSDFQPKFASEKLEEDHQIKLSKEKVRQIMTEMKLWKPKPRKKNNEYHSWRKRKDCYGEMEQFDGSYYDWFERGRNDCLLGSIDDATSRITFLMFAPNEGVKPVFSSWKEYLLLQGKPLKIYLDKFSTYKNTHQSVIDDPDILTQFQRAMRQLDIEPISAYSPQAKGRIERLWLTLQHRLVREMRLAGIKTVEEANQFVKKVFISKSNDQFSVLPTKKGDLHRKLTKIEKEQLDGIFSHQETRIVNNDLTIRYKRMWFQLSKEQPVLVRKEEKTLVEERIDNSICIALRGKYLVYTVLPERPKKIIESRLPAKRKFLSSSSSWKPAVNHPWKKFVINPHRKSKIKVRV